MTKQYAASTERNREDILSVLRQVLPDRGTILEIASGTGQHAVYFASRFPKALWQPSDRTPETLASIRAWVVEADLPNLNHPLELDVTAEEWPIDAADAIVNINMLHISPWRTCEGLLAGASRVLHSGAPLYYYGAFFRHDRETSQSNIEFDRSLRTRDASWGVRQLEDVLELARSHGLSLDRVVDMPRNNYSLVLRRD